MAASNRYQDAVKGDADAKSEIAKADASYGKGRRCSY